MRAAEVQASLRIRAVSPEPSLLAHTSSESRGTFRQKARSLVPLNGWACAVKICHNGMLEDTNSLDGAHMITGETGHLNRSSTRYSMFNVLMTDPVSWLCGDCGFLSGHLWLSCTRKQTHWFLGYTCMGDVTMRKHHRAEQRHWWNAADEFNPWQNPCRGLLHFYQHK